MTDLEQRCRRLAVEPRQLEASVRREPDGRWRADRMMIERASDETVALVEADLGLRLSPLARLLRDATRDAGQPIIVGWDGRACLKLYANLSDAAGRVRAGVARALALPGEPHVIGVNLHADGRAEWKAYRQAADASAARAEATFGSAAGQLVARTATLGAGVVISHDVEPGAPVLGPPRAFFVALRPTSPDDLDAALGGLPDFSFEAVASRLPFLPTSPRSIGIALSDPRSWTVYVKPRTEAPELHALEPAAVFASEGGEVGVFVAPSDETPRAYVRTGGLAISYRVRAGAPAGPEVDALLRWVAERLGSGGPDADLRHPPAPWRAVA